MTIEFLTIRRAQTDPKTSESESAPLSSKFTSKDKHDSAFASNSSTAAASGAPPIPISDFTFQRDLPEYVVMEHQAYEHNGGEFKQKPAIQ